MSIVHTHTEENTDTSRAASVSVRHDDLVRTDRKIPTKSAIYSRIVKYNIYRVEKKVSCGMMIST